MTRKVAIILHGPPCSGKSTASTELQRRLKGIVRHISFDDGWLPGEVRYRGGTGRYADIANATEPVLIIEIGCGEPPDLSVPGSTRAAHEWVDVLRQSGREIFPFLLAADSSDLVARLERRLDDRIRKGQQRSIDKLFLLWQFLGLQSLYEHRHPLATFPSISGFKEHPLQTTGRSEAEIVDEILALTRLP